MSLDCQTNVSALALQRFGVEGKLKGLSASEMGSQVEK